MKGWLALAIGLVACQTATTDLSKCSDVGHFDNWMAVSFEVPTSEKDVPYTALSSHPESEVSCRETKTDEHGTTHSYRAFVEPVSCDIPQLKKAKGKQLIKPARLEHLVGENKKKPDGPNLPFEKCAQATAAAAFAYTCPVSSLRQIVLAVHNTAQSVKEFVQIVRSLTGNRYHFTYARYDDNVAYTAQAESLITDPTVCFMVFSSKPPSKETEYMDGYFFAAEVGKPGKSQGFKSNVMTPKQMWKPKVTEFKDIPSHLIESVETALSNGVQPSQDKVPDWLKPFTDFNIFLHVFEQANVKFEPLHVSGDLRVMKNTIMAPGTRGKAVDQRNMWSEEEQGNNTAPMPESTGLFNAVSFQCSETYPLASTSLDYLSAEFHKEMRTLSEGKHGYQCTLELPFLPLFCPDMGLRRMIEHDYYTNEDTGKTVEKALAYMKASGGDDHHYMVASGLSTLLIKVFLGAHLYHDPNYCMAMLQYLYEDMPYPLFGQYFFVMKLKK